MKLPIGISDFKKIILGKYDFADKSLFIKEIIEDGASVILIVRPRRFGKTLNLSMLYYFLQINSHKNHNIFEKLHIFKDQEFCLEHQNKYPVIFISFKDIKRSSIKDAQNDIETLISQLYTEHIYLLDDDLLYEHEKITYNSLLLKIADKSDLIKSIKNLTEYLQRKFSKSPILLRDEYDTPIQESYLKGYYLEMVELMRSILGQALKDNVFLSKAIITGITKIAQESLFSGLNNIQSYSVLKTKYGQYFGFTEEEVDHFLQRGKVENHSYFKEWYNGYQIGDYFLYNPWSIINCLSNDSKLQPYWLNTSSSELIDKLIRSSNILVKQKFEALLQGQVIEQAISENLVFPDLEFDSEALWILLLYTGYLKVLSSKLKGNRLMAKIAIPNKEVSFVYDKIVERWFSLVTSLESYDNFIKSLISGDMKKFKLYLSIYITQLENYFNFTKNTKEQIFHVFILGLVVGLRDHYLINSNEELGLGNLNVIFIPKSSQANGIMLEFKIAETEEELDIKADQALSKIKEQQHFQTFKKHNITNVSAIGLAFFNNQVALSHEIIIL